jgi:hypothetical protein
VFSLGAIFMWKRSINQWTVITPSYCLSQQVSKNQSAFFCTREKKRVVYVVHLRTGNTRIFELPQNCKNFYCLKNYEVVLIESVYSCWLISIVDFVANTTRVVHKTQEESMYCFRHKKVRFLLPPISRSNLKCHRQKQILDGWIVLHKDAVQIFND